MHGSPVPTFTLLPLTKGTTMNRRSLARAHPLSTILAVTAAAAALFSASPAAQAQNAAPTATAAPSGTAAPTTLRLAVNGMVCSFCAQGIEARLKALPQTGSLYISLKDKVVAVEPKAGQTLPLDKVKAEVVEAGYDITAATFVPQTVAEIRAEARARR
jgi:periplasmic mercuric ion binding protein